MAKPPIWIIDTSSILEVRRLVRRDQQKRVFADLGALVAQGHLVFPKQVFAELERHSRPADPADLPYQWAKKHKSHACRLGTDYSRLHTLLAHPQIGKVVDPDKTGVEEADPYVLALADELKERYEVTILCEEVRDRPDKLSMASACGLLRIVTLRLGPFLVSQRIYPKP